MQTYSNPTNNMQTHTPGHTPGPWRLAHNNNNESHAIKTCSEAPVTICSISVWNPHLVSDEERKANARLIATAPELLDALQTVQQISAMATEYNRVHADNLLAMMKEIESVASTVIAKATS